MQLQKFLNILLDINEFAVTNNAFLVVYDEPISRTISVSAVNLSGPFFLCKWSFSLYDWNQLPNNIRMAFGSARVRVYFFSRLTKKRFSIDGLLHLFENEVMLEAINEEWIQICRRIISKQLDEKDAYKEKLKMQVWNLKHVPMNAKEAIVELIEGKKQKTLGEY